MCDEDEDKVNGRQDEVVLADGILIIDFVSEDSVERTNAYKFGDVLFHEWRELVGPCYLRRAW